MARRERRDSQEALLDAAERLLEREGAISITTRKVAAEADINPALVHYYFESIEDLCAKVIERFSEDLIERQRRIFHSEGSLSEQWRQATEPLRSHVGRRRMKVWFELSALAVNRPALLARLVEINRAWRDIIRTAVEREFASRPGINPGIGVDALAALMSVALKGLYWENLMDFHDGHDQLIVSADRMLANLDDQGSLGERPRRALAGTRKRR